jgi:hypothetical protein
MAITQAMANSFKLEILQGVHESGDTYKIALYTSAATGVEAVGAIGTVTAQILGSGFGQQFAGGGSSSTKTATRVTATARVGGVAARGRIGLVWASGQSVARVRGIWAQGRIGHVTVEIGPDLVADDEDVFLVEAA